MSALREVLCAVAVDMLILGGVALLLAVVTA